MWSCMHSGIVVCLNGPDWHFALLKLMYISVLYPTSMWIFIIISTAVLNSRQENYGFALLTTKLILKIPT